MGTKSLSFPPSAEDRKTHILSDKPLFLDSAIAHVASPTFGAIVTFTGCVRDTENDAPITSISYESYASMAESEIQKIIQSAEKRWRVRMSIQHRTGKVPVGEASLIVACAGVHRPEAFEACRFVIDEIKSKVPIWKVEFEGASST